MRISGITYIPRKTHKVRNITIFSLIVILLSVITVLIISAVSGWKLIHPAKSPITAFSANIVPEFRDVSFYDIDKEINLKGWLFPSKGSTKTVIFAHGYGKNRLQFGEKTLDIVKALLGKGYNVLLFDFRNSGLSGGDKTSIGVFERKDILGAVKFARAQGSEKIALLGYSMGASSSILAAGESDSIDAVIADSPFSDLKEYLNTSLPVWSKLPSFPFNKTVILSVKLMSGIDPAKASPKEALARFSPKPVLLIHSKDDKSIPVENSRELYDIYSKAAGSSSEFWETSGAGHVGSYEKYPDEYLKRVIEFLDKSI